MVGSNSSRTTLSIVKVINTPQTTESCRTRPEKSQNLWMPGLAPYKL